MIRLVATDLDGTAFLGGRLSEVNKQTINKAIDSGVEVAFATGRALGSIPEEAYVNCNVTYAITSNGAKIYNVKTRELLRNYVITPEEAMRMFKIGQSVGTEYEIFINGKGYVSQKYYDNPALYGMPENLVEYIRTSRVPVPDIFEHIKKYASEIESFAYVIKDLKMHDEVMGMLKEKCPDNYVVDSEPQWIEVMNNQSGKDKGVRHLANLLNVNMDEVAAFGDGDNDIEMLQCAKVSVAMNNASPKCKDAAKYISKDVKEDGLSYGIECILNGDWE